LTRGLVTFPRHQRLLSSVFGAAAINGFFAEIFSAFNARGVNLGADNPVDSDAVHMLS
jgi:hypothetical protein